MSEDQLRCLFIGFGNISRAMLPVFREKPWFAPAGVVDIDPEARRRGIATMGLPEDASFEKLPDALRAVEADVVVVNTPSEWHYEHTRIAVEAGKHVLVAKPITNSYDEAAELVLLAEEAGVTLSVGQQIRYNRHYGSLRRFVRKGRLGDVEAAWFMNSKPRPKVQNLGVLPQPAIFENSCHHFDAFLSIFEGRAPEWTMCDGFVPSWSPYPGPCMINAMIGFEGGLHMQYHGGFSSRAPMYEFRMEGTEGALACHGLHMSNDTMSYEFAPALGKFKPAEIDADIPVANPFVRFLDLWYVYVRGDEPPPFSGRNNLKVMAIAEAGVRSMEKGRRVEIAGNPHFVEAFR